MYKRLRDIAAVWIDSDRHAELTEPVDDQKIDWLRMSPFLLLQAMALGVLFVSFSWFAVGFALVTYAIRMFAITAFYHRYFAHKAFKTSRFMQFLFAAIGATATQRGALWWAAHHRGHHKHSDTMQDPHTPKLGFFWSHMGWFMHAKNVRTETNNIPDLMRYPELRWLDRYDMLIPVLFAAAIFGLGVVLKHTVPSLETNGVQLLFWGYFFSTTVLIHCTLTINSLAHLFGRRRYKTNDTSRNNWFLAIITLGEGWHNNHHHFPGSARQGFYWWEIDICFYILKAMSWLGLVYDLKPVPYAIREKRDLRSHSVPITEKPF